MSIRLLTCIVLYIIFAGWLFSSKNILDPHTGIGYAFGIIGGLSMLTTLTVYSLKKRLNIFRNSRAVEIFKWHMRLGIIGPIFILYHCNFRLGADNSNIALWSMLTVMVSGVIGKFLQNKKRFERAFALWHVAHLPFVFILVISALVHIVAVHVY